MPLWLRTLILTGPLEQVEAARDEHLRHLADLRAEGRLRVAGRWSQGEGYLDVFEALDRLAAEELARKSPFIREGLCAWTLRDWQSLDNEP